MASAKIQGLRDWIDADQTSRGYAGMTDAQVATDMVVTEQLPAGNITSHDIRQNLHMPERINQWDGLPEGQGDNVDGKRARIQSIDNYLAGFGNEAVPGHAYDHLKLLVQRAFGNSSTSKLNVDALLDGDTISRAAMLGFAGEDEAKMTVRVQKARAL